MFISKHYSPANGFYFHLYLNIVLTLKSSCIVLSTLQQFSKRDSPRKSKSTYFLTISTLQHFTVETVPISTYLLARGRQTTATKRCRNPQKGNEESGEGNSVYKRLLRNSKPPKNRHSYSTITSHTYKNNVLPL